MRRRVLVLALPLLLSACNACNTASTEEAPGPSPGSPGTGTEAPPSPALLDPSLAKEQAPATFKARFTTTKGVFVVGVDRALAPNGADRFYNLVKTGFFDGTRFFRVVDGFMVQWGIHGNPRVASAWKSANIPDDPVKGSNKRGYITFATAGPNTRTTQVFINYVDDNSRLDGSGFAPFGKVEEGMDVVDALFKGYGEGAPMGRGPSQGRLQAEGNAYLETDFPKLDAIQRAELVK